MTTGIDGELVALSRRDALRLGGAGLALAGGTSSTLSPVEGAAVSPKKSVTVEEATNIALSRSPDGKYLVFDLLGILWIMPVDGGPARRLTGDYDDAALPDWSPDGSTILFQSFRSGNFHLWTVPAKGGPLKQLTTGLHDHREPVWSPDGKRVAFSADRSDGRYAIHILDMVSSEIVLLSKGKSQDAEPCWSPDGREIAYVADGVKLLRMSIADGEPRQVASVPPPRHPFEVSEIHAPCFAPNGALYHIRATSGGMALFREDMEMVSDEDIYPFRPAFTPDGGFIYAADGKIRQRNSVGETKILSFFAAVTVTQPLYKKKKRDFDSTAPQSVVGIVAPGLSPDGKSIVFAALNDLYIMRIGERPKVLVGDAHYKCDPAWSPDGKWIAYSSDKGGTLDIWLKDVATGAERQLTNVSSKGLAYAAWSPGGDHIACIDQDGALHLVTIATGAIRQLFDPIWEPGRPSFGPGGKTIACAAFKPVSARFREGLNEILIIDVEAGDGFYNPAVPGKSIAVRGLDGPAWSPDGTKMAFVIASTLWVAPVDIKGRLTGPARQITTEVTDAPSWSGDSASLLYLSKGKLRLISVDGGAPRTIACKLSWANAKPQARIVIQPEMLWDAIADKGVAGKEVVIDGNKIRAILPTGTVQDQNAQRMAAPGQTLMPGLVDMHTHRQMQGYNYGNRMGPILLSLGITATRSPGCPAYHMVEDREAIQSGRRIAPRHYATGEALDGNRIFYNFMRPVTEPGQMKLEMERARALDYDMIKTYVRLRHDVQAVAVDHAHALGIHLSSHYHYPALNSGMDCMEHMGATNRNGYSRTMTTLGAGYQDVNGLFAAASALRTPTLFNALALLGEDDSLAVDRRVKLIFSLWEYEKVQMIVHLMQGEERQPVLAMLRRQVDQIKQTIRSGGRIITGTDMPIDLVGISLHLNLRALVYCGISPVDALFTATRNAGEFLDEPIGRIAPGMIADLILVRGDPLSDINAAAAVDTVFANGFTHRPEALIRPFAKNDLTKLHNPVLPTLAAKQDYFWHDPDYVQQSRSACCADHIRAIPA